VIRSLAIYYEIFSDQQSAFSFATLRSWQNSLIGELFAKRLSEKGNNILDTWPTVCQVYSCPILMTATAPFGTDLEKLPNQAAGLLGCPKFDAKL